MCCFIKRQTYILLCNAQLVRHPYPPFAFATETRYVPGVPICGKGDKQGSSAEHAL